MNEACFQLTVLCIQLKLSSLQQYCLNSFTVALAFLAKCSKDGIQLAY